MRNQRFPSILISVPVGVFIGIIVFTNACQRDLPKGVTEPEIVANSLVTTVTLTPTPPIIVMRGGPVTPNTPTLPLPSATPLPGLPTATPIPSPTAPIPALPLPTPGPLVDFYEVQPGDTLSGISWAYNIPIEDILSLNNFGSADVLINIGQQIKVPLTLDRLGPTKVLLPDSEVVYSPAYLDFNTAAFIEQQGGYLAQYSERVNGRPLSGTEIVDLVTHQFSVGPRVLLAVLEFYGGWVTQPELKAEYPAGRANPYGDRLYLQLGWIANRINAGYYGYKQNGQFPIRFRNRERALIPTSLNAGTAGIQNLLALNTDWDTWQQELRPSGFIRTYYELFGDPFQYDIQPLIPYNLTQPPLRLPWQSGETFYFTGGPHGAYGEGSAGAAIDFAPPDVLGSCYYSEKYLTAAAEGRVMLGETGQLYLDLDFDGRIETGWVLFYLHIVPLEELKDGQIIPAGSPIGYASCEGGLANASHLHLARRYNGEWMAAGGPVPMVLSGWQVIEGPVPYDGELVRGDERRVSGEFWDEDLNAVTAD